MCILEHFTHSWGRQERWYACEEVQIHPTCTHTYLHSYMHSYHLLRNGLLSSFGLNSAQLFHYCVDIIPGRLLLNTCCHPCSTHPTLHTSVCAPVHFQTSYRVRVMLSSQAYGIFRSKYLSPLRDLESL